MSFKEIRVPPNEGISSVFFEPVGCSALATTSWTGKVRFYSQEFTQVTEFAYQEALTCGVWISQDAVAAGSSSGSIIVTGSDSWKAHTSGVSSIFLIPDHVGQLVSASWDETIKVWDMSSVNSGPCVTVTLGDRVLSAHATSNSRVVAHGSKQFVYVIDLRSPEHYEKRVSSLGHQIRSSCSSRPERYGWAVGSIDGRIAVEYFGEPGQQAQRFAFSCNRRDEENEVVVYPVNALSFNPVTGVLVSGSCNGDLAFWDVGAKRKLNEIQSLADVGVASIDHSPDGALLAVAYSYTWDKGDVPHANDKLVMCQL